MLVRAHEHHTPCGRLLRSVGSIAGMSASARAAEFLDAITHRSTERLRSILAERVHVEFPYDEGQRDHQFHGRDAVVAYFAAAFDYLEPIVFADIIEHRCADSHETVIEFRGTSRWVTDLRPYHQRYIAIVGTDEDDRIVRYREYRNPGAY